MKLIKCHIENFGKLQDYNHDFGEGVNAILEENGWGKSTLATFIRVMLYGFDNEGKKDMSNERKRFAPWQGGVYGGQLTFEAKGKRYRADRTFGKKAEEDTFVLYDADTMKPSTDFSKDLGSELFAIDSASFLKTIFIRQQDCKTDCTPRIQAKISKVEDQAADLANYSEAYDMLSGVQKTLTNSRKGSDMQNMKDELASLETQVRGKEDQQAIIDELGSRIAKLRAEETDRKEDLATTREQQKELSNYLDLQSLQERYTAVCTARDQAARHLEEEKKFFPGNVPDEKQVDEAQYLAAGLDADQKAEEAYRLEEEEKHQLLRLGDKFKGVIPEEKALEELEEQVGVFRQFTDEMAEIRPSAEELKTLETETAKYEFYMPSIEELQALSDDWKSAQEKRSTLADRRAHADALKELAEEKARAKSPTFRMNTPLILGFVLLGLGVIAILLPFLPVPALKEMQTLLMIIAATFLLVGGAAVIVGILFGRKSAEINMKKMKIDYPEEYTTLAREISKDKDFIEGVSQDIEDMLKNGEISYDENNVTESVTKMMEEIEGFLLLRQKKTKWEEGGYEDRLQELKGKVEEKFRVFFPNMPAEEDYQTVVQELRYDAREYSRLKKKEDSHAEALKNLTERTDKLYAALDRFGFLPAEDLGAQMTQIRDHMKSCQIRAQQLAEEEQKVKDFEAAEDVSRLEHMPEPPKEMSMQVLTDRAEELTATLEKIGDDINNYQSQLDEGTERLELIEAREIRIEELKGKIEENTRKGELVTQTLKYLEQAKDAFSVRYVKPVRAAFEKYYGMICGDNKVYTLNSDLQITVSEAGAEREPGLLSTGYQDLIGLCRRIAMTDAMYEEEKPFLILDDPFVNLDEKKLKGAGEFLKEIGKEYQILYLVCHSSRT